MNVRIRSGRKTRLKMKKIKESIERIYNFDPSKCETENYSQEDLNEIFNGIDAIKVRDELKRMLDIINTIDNKNRENKLF